MKKKVAIKLSQHIPIISAIIGKNQYDFGVDSGAETNLIDEKYYKKVKKHLSNESSDSLIGAENKEKIVKTASLTELVIGGSIPFKNTNIVFSDISHLNQAYQLNIDGILGYEILSKYPTFLSYSRKEIIFFKK
ncbi:retropepsin-like domain-containing protein [Flavobacterium piscinae]|uniref:aspartyl protease family protein n=1 Tax=Flavobacterium piscinae TaxID=2506424 RepID=UPI0019CB14FF|nr:aspartyl protease family protein [Flavobacterium piscinae]MBC8884085.1 retropepsin-like domain-containing protein [Flavobacterium piscinae]